jgi:hypothetical protein
MCRGLAPVQYQLLGSVLDSMLKKGYVQLCGSEEQGSRKVTLKEVLC